MSDEPQNVASEETASSEAAEAPRVEAAAVAEAAVAATPSGPASDVVLAPASTPSSPMTLAQPRPVTPVPLTWRSWPVVDSLGEFLMLAAALIVPPIVLFQTAGPIAAALLEAAIVFVIWKHFVPTQFELSALGVTEERLGRTRRIPWISIDRYLVGRLGVYLSSTGAPLELFRGLYLPWGSHREQILTTLRYYLPRAEIAAD